MFIDFRPVWVSVCHFLNMVIFFNHMLVWNMFSCPHPKMEISKLVFNPRLKMGYSQVVSADSLHYNRA